ERAPEVELGAGLAKQVEILRVIELECRVAGDADSDESGWGRQVPLGTTLALGPAPSRLGERLHLAREQQETVKIDGAVDGIAEATKLCCIEHALRRRHQPEVSLWERQRLVAGDRAERRRAARGGDRVQHHAAVALASHAVDDDAGQAQFGIEALEAPNHRRGAPGRRPRVHHQHHGCVEPLRDLRRRALLARAVDAVEAPHHAFDHGEVGAARVTRDAREDGLAPAHPAVEVVRGVPGGERVEARIDEVRSHLERLDPEATPSERLEQPERDRGLADAGGHPRDHQHARGHRPDAPSDWLTPADLNVAISRQISAAARARWMKRAAPVPSPRRSARSRYGASPRWARTAAWPGSAERCEAKSAARAAGASVTATRAAAPAMKPSSTTGTRRDAPARITP